jgi:hypothetical protein
MRALEDARIVAERIRENAGQPHSRTASGTCRAAEEKWCERKRLHWRYIQRHWCKKTRFFFLIFATATSIRVYNALSDGSALSTR